jgi:hypothetical protein
VVYDGSTSLANLPITGKNNYYLLFTDGLVNFDDKNDSSNEKSDNNGEFESEHDNETINNTLLAPVYAICTATIANFDYLKVIGMLISLYNNIY